MGMFVKDRRFTLVGDGDLYMIQGSTYSHPVMYVDEEAGVIFRAYLLSHHNKYYIRENFHSSHHLFEEEKCLEEDSSE